MFQTVSPCEASLVGSLAVRKRPWSQADSEPVKGGFPGFINSLDDATIVAWEKLAGEIALAA